MFSEVTALWIGCWSFDISAHFLLVYYVVCSVFKLLMTALTGSNPLTSTMNNRIIIAKLSIAANATKQDYLFGIFLAILDYNVCHNSGLYAAAAAAHSEFIYGHSYISSYQEV